MKCTSWCPPQVIPNPNIDLLFYRFSDINNGIPTDYCYTKLNNYIADYGKIILYSCLGVTAFLAIVLLFNLCICCHPNQKKKGGYRRF